MDDLARAQELLRRFGSTPRAAGSAADAAARRDAADILAGSGFDVREESFAYSALPGRFGTPLIGAAVCAALASAGHLASRDYATPALAILLAVAIAAALAGRWLARDGVLDMRAMRREGVNLVATRGGEAPLVWLVAHTDSKSQPVPQALRAAGIVGLGVVWLFAAILAAAQVGGYVDPGMPGWIGVTLVGMLFGAPVVLSIVGNESAGTLDNASGVAAVLLAAERVPRDVPMGVLITTAEELGLAGARAWARSRSGIGHIALNCDGVDDVGTLTAMFTGRSPARVLEAMTEAAARTSQQLRIMRLVPGILVDAVALADAGWEAATLSRGTVATLGRVHTRRDTLAAMDGVGIPAAAAVLAGAAERLATGKGG